MATREKIEQVVSALGLESHAALIESLIQPSIRIVATALAPRPALFRNQEGVDTTDADKLAQMEQALAALPLGASRFGGVPDLPPGVEWPARDGVPMEFIAQIRLADLAGLDPDRRLPPSGHLIFFYNSQWGVFDMDPEARTCAVVFHDGSDDALVRATPPQVEWKSEFTDVTQVAPFLHGLAGLRFEAEVSLPNPSSPFAPEALRERWYDLHSTVQGGGGDPYHESFLLGYVDESDYVDAHKNGTGDQLLLQVDSEAAAEFQFGDCQKLFFLLSKAELAARDFSGVRVYSILG